MQHDHHKKHIEHPSHVQAMIESFSQIFQVPTTSFLLIFILAFALFLPAGFYVLWKNMNAFSDSWNQSAEISLYLKKSVNPTLVSNLIEKLKQSDVAAKVRLISPNDGMKDFLEHTGFGEILTGFKENPLPNVIVVQLKLRELSEGQLVPFVNSLKNFSEVETVKADMSWIEYSHGLLKLWERLSLILAILLGMGATTIICWTTYITPQIIINKINTSKRVLQYQYFWYGLISGLIMLASINFILMLLQNSYFILPGLGTGCGAAFVLFGTLLGVISSRFAMIKIK